MAAGLAARGVGRGDVVALLLPSTPLYLLAYLGAARLGAVTTGINVRYRRTEIGHILRRSGRALLLAVDTLARRRLPRRRRRRSAAAAGAAGRRLVRRRPAAREHARRASTRSRATAPPRRRVAVAPDDPVAIVFTSGTTGVPKGAWYTHREPPRPRRDRHAPLPGRRARRSRKHLAAGLSFAHVGTMLRIALQIAHLGDVDHPRRVRPRGRARGGRARAAGAPGRHPDADRSCCSTIPTGRAATCRRSARSCSAARRRRRRSSAASQRDARRRA